MARLEGALRPKVAATGTIEYHSPSDTSDPSGRLQPCDRRDEHGPACVMTVSPTSSGVRFMRIIQGVEHE